MATDSGNAPVVVFDCETTGLGRHDRIVEIAVVTLDPVTLEITDEYDTLVNPERDVGPVGLHGITPPMVEAAPVFEEVVAALARRLHGRTLVSHNLPFDVRMLRYEFERMGVAFSPGAGVCTQKATRQKLSAAATCSASSWSTSTARSPTPARRHRCSGRCCVRRSSRPRRPSATSRRR